MTYLNCMTVIENKKNILNGDDFKSFTTEIKEKLDVFLLNDRISDEQYSELIALLK